MSFVSDWPGVPERLCLRSREAATALGVSPRTLATWVQQGQVPYVRVRAGRRSTLLFPVDALRAWLVSRAETAISGGGRQ